MSNNVNWSTITAYSKAVINLGTKIWSLTYHFWKDLFIIWILLQLCPTIEHVVQTFVHNLQIPPYNLSRTKLKLGIRHWKTITLHTPVSLLVTWWLSHTQSMTFWFYYFVNVELLWNLIVLEHPSYTFIIKVFSL